MEATHASPAASVGREQPVLMAWKITLGLAWTAGATLGSAPSPSWLTVHLAMLPIPKKGWTVLCLCSLTSAKYFQLRVLKTAGEINVKLRRCLFGFFFFKAFSQSVFVIFLKIKWLKPCKSPRFLTVPCASYSRQIFKNITLVLIKALRMLTNYQRESKREN